MPPPYPLVLDKQVAYWKEQLAGAPALLDLPSDHPRPPVQRYRGASLSFSLPDELTAQLKDFSQRTGATLFMTLWSAFAVLMARYSGRDDIVIGSPIAGRTRTETESLIGFFINTLALRLDLGENPSFEAVLQQAKGVTLEAHAHQDIPFEHLVEVLQPPRNLGHAPLFQVLFVLQNAPLPDLELPGLELTLLELEAVTAKFDVTLEFRETAAGFTGRLEYDTDLFERATMERLVGHLRTLLQGIVAAPDTPIHELPLLTEAERRQFLAWNDTAVEYPRDKTIIDLFEEQVEKTPDAVAVVFPSTGSGQGEDEEVGYGELNARANRLAHRLRALGVGPEVLVGLFVERSVEMVVGLLAILKAGGAYVPLDPEYPTERLAFMAEDAELKILLCHGRTRDRIPDCTARILDMDAEAATIAGDSVDNPAPLTGPENLAYVIYTSGSTGEPKGVTIEHRSTVALIHWSQSRYSLKELSGVLAAISVCFDLSVYEIFLPLSVGGMIILVEDTLALPNIETRNRVTLINTVPSAIKGLLNSSGIPASVRTINLAGEPLSQNVVEKLYGLMTVQKVYDLYGPSEDTTYSTCALRQQGSFPTIGHPISNTQTYILDGCMQPVPIGIPGELHIGGAGVARGYLNRPELTAEKFIPNPFSEGPGARLYRTGDACRWLPDGTIEFLGRIDNQVKLRGFRIELGEIEAALTQHPDVQEAVVVIREDEPGDRRLVACIVSDLIPTRVPYESDCRLEYQGGTASLQTVDICTAGALLAGDGAFEKGGDVRLRIRIPGDSETRWLRGRVAYSRGDTTGIDFKLTPEEQTLMERGVTHELEDKGFVNFLQYSLRDKLRRTLREKLPDYMVPSDFVLLMSLPLTPNGKVDRRALSERPIRALQLPEEDFVPPRTADEKALAAIWAEVLKAERVGIHDDFFELGGHSLLAVTLLSRIEARFGRHLPLSVLFQGATVAELARQLDNAASLGGGAQGAIDPDAQGAVDPW
uniref:Amino acid adenylation domain-containing protein n=1 Tax=Candidatus Kentrum sp. LFY TaxID=2126342 RepID=A0A450UMB8_9GAMM|nr:MAG: amino acid adenylation domain-containing protein [Candidatus Kentron sp. LFY]